VTASNLEGLYTNVYGFSSRIGRVRATTYDRKPTHVNAILCQCCAAMELFFPPGAGRNHVECVSRFRLFLIAETVLVCRALRV